MYSINPPPSCLECVHGDILSHSTLEDIPNTNHTTVPNINTTKQCVEECCSVRDCDVAMVNNKTCYLVSCREEGACTVQHLDANASVQSEMAFILSKYIPGRWWTFSKHSINSLQICIVELINYS